MLVLFSSLLLHVRTRKRLLVNVHLPHLPQAEDDASVVLIKCLGLMLAQPTVLLEEFIDVVRIEKRFLRCNKYVAVFIG